MIGRERGMGRGRGDGWIMKILFVVRHSGIIGYRDAHEFLERGAVQADRVKLWSHLSLKKTTLCISAVTTRRSK